MAVSTAAISALHFTGLLKPNKDLQQQQQQGAGGATLKDAAAVTASTAKAALTDAAVISSAVQDVTNQLGNVAKVRQAAFVM